MVSNSVSINELVSSDYEITLVSGGPPSLIKSWLVSGSLEGRGWSLRFDQELQPTDDEILSRIRPPVSTRVLRPSNLAERLDYVAELAQARQAILACVADGAAFTALERSRLNGLADLLTQRIKSFV